MIAIIDYGVGNLNSIHNMFKRIGVSSLITSCSNEIKEANRYLLPGVGSFDYAIKNLRSRNYFNILEKEVLINNKPILGICLGMQLLTISSEEGCQLGLGWINAQTVQFNNQKSNLPIPHMGWNNVDFKCDNNLSTNLKDNKFYFVHSYHVVCNTEDQILATTNYGSTFTSIINKNNIFGVQFHPEKSHKFGMQLLKNFSSI